MRGEGEGGLVVGLRRVPPLTVKMSSAADCWPAVLDMAVEPLVALQGVL